MQQIKKMVEATTDIQRLSDSLWRRTMKKAKDQPKPVVILQLRTLSTAIEILDWISNIPFEELAVSLYFYCQDVNMAQFTRWYEAQLELAGANKEKFATGLHRFFTETAKKIQKNNLYDEFFEFYYRCVKLRLQNDNERVNQTVITAYQNLLIQQLEYLRPSKFDFNTFVAGRKTTGEIITRKDCFPTFDHPIYQVRWEIEAGKRIADAEEHLYELYRKTGYDIHNADDQNLIIAQDKIHTTTCSILLPFINEYTFDIIPQKIYNGNSNILHFLMNKVDLPALREDLKHRKRTLPTNGVRIAFDPKEEIGELLMKELLYDNSIYMLYRLSTENGDLSGVYETKDSFFSSICQSSEGHKYLADRVEAFILYCYASQVLGGKYALQSANDYIAILGCQELTLTAYGMGGQLRNTYDGQHHRREGEYEAGEASIQGYIRRLPVGQRASREARDLAESLGYDLESNETYVRPFIKQVFRLKEKEKE